MEAERAKMRHIVREKSGKLKDDLSEQKSLLRHRLPGSRVTGQTATGLGAHHATAKNKVRDDRQDRTLHPLGPIVMWFS